MPWSSCWSTGSCPGATGTESHGLTDCFALIKKSAAAIQTTSPLSFAGPRSGRLRAGRRRIPSRYILDRFVRSPLTGTGTGITLLSFWTARPVRSLTLSGDNIDQSKQAARSASSRSPCRVAFRCFAVLRGYRHGGIRRLRNESWRKLFLRLDDRGRQYHWLLCLVDTRTDDCQGRPSARCICLADRGCNDPACCLYPGGTIVHVSGSRRTFLASAFMISILPMCSTLLQFFLY